MPNPVFILSTGRCGTLALQKFLQNSSKIEAFHRYRGRRSRYRNSMQFMLEQNYAYYYVLRSQYRNPKSRHFVIRSLQRSREPLIQTLRSEGKKFVELNHAFSAFGRLLTEAFPDAKFVHLVRDPKAVISSFMQKFDPPPMALPAFMGTRYSLRGQYTLRETHFRNLAKLGSRSFQNFIKNHFFDTHIHPFEKMHGKWQENFEMDTFEKTCWYWNEINKIIMELFEYLPGERKIIIYFEDIFNTKSERSMKSLLDFVEMNDISVEYMKRFFGERINEKELYNSFPDSGQWTGDMLKTMDYYCRESLVKLGYS